MGWMNTCHVVLCVRKSNKPGTKAKYRPGIPCWQVKGDSSLPIGILQVPFEPLVPVLTWNSAKPKYSFILLDKELGMGTQPAPAYRGTPPCTGTELISRIILAATCPQGQALTPPPGHPRPTPPRVTPILAARDVRLPLLFLPLHRLAGFPTNARAGGGPRHPTM